MNITRFVLPASLVLLLGANAFADPSPAASAPAKREFGQATRDLLHLQASGTAAAKKLPILGDQASASYKRYIDSFKHPLPEHFEEAVKTQNGN